MYQSSMLLPASLYDKKTVPGPYLSGWFAFSFNGWEALSVILEASDEDDAMSLVMIPQGREDDWLAFQQHIRHVLYKVLHRVRKKRLDIIGSSQEGRSAVEAEVKQ